MASLDMQLISDLKELMEDEFPSLVEIYLHDSVDRMQQIEAAVTAADGDKVRHAAHSLKGSSSNIGAVELVTLCQKLEEMGKANQLDAATAQVTLIQSELAHVHQALKDVLAG